MAQTGSRQSFEQTHSNYAQRSDVKPLHRAAGLFGRQFNFVEANGSRHSEDQLPITVLRTFALRGRNRRAATARRARLVCRSPIANSDWMNGDLGRVREQAGKGSRLSFTPPSGCCRKKDAAAIGVRLGDEGRLRRSDRSGRIPGWSCKVAGDNQLPAGSLRHSIGARRPGPTSTKGERGGRGRTCRPARHWARCSLGSPMRTKPKSW